MSPVDPILIFSTIILPSQENRSLSASGLNGRMMPDVLAISSCGTKCIEIVSKTQTIFTEASKIGIMKALNPSLNGWAINWIFGGWFFL